MTNKTILVLGLIGSFAIGSLAATPVADALSPVLASLIGEVDTMQVDCPAGQVINGFADNGTPVCVDDSVGTPSQFKDVLRFGTGGDILALGSLTNYGMAGIDGELTEFRW